MVDGHDPGLPTPITWSHYYPGVVPWSAQPTCVLVRFAAHAEHLMATDPVRARSQGERLFRVGLEQIYTALNERISLAPVTVSLPLSVGLVGTVHLAGVTHIQCVGPIGADGRCTRCGEATGNTGGMHFRRGAL